MENVGGCVAQFLNDEAVIWGTTDAPFRDSDEMADFFKIDRERMRFRVPYVGGHFGAKNVTNYMLAALFLSRKSGRPVKTLPTTEASFRTTARHGMIYTAKAGVKSDGTLTALDVEMIIDTGAYTTGAVLATHNMVISAWGCYRIPNVRIKARCAYTNKVPASHTRATGKFQTTWAIECLIDSVARKMGIDPTDFRKKNVLRQGEFVAEGTPPMDADYLDMMDKAAAAINWDGYSSVEHQGRSDSNSLSLSAKGRALVLTLRNGNQGGGRAYAMATVDVRGNIKIHHNAPDPGQGSYKLIAIVDAKTQELPQTQITVGEQDTAVSKPSPDPYIRAAQLHGVAPSSCVAIEDSRWGIESARAAGFKCVGITTTYAAPELWNADRVIDSLHQFNPDLIRSL